MEWNGVREEARRRFGVVRFRPGQRALIESVLPGVTCCPPAAASRSPINFPRCFCRKAMVVVSPLVALMQDQQEKLAQVHVDSAPLNSPPTPAFHRVHYVHTLWRRRGRRGGARPFSRAGVKTIRGRVSLY